MIFRKAKVRDVPEMHGLVNLYASQGLMLPRARSTFYEHLRDYIVVEKDQEIIGVAALHIIWEDLAEIRSVAVAPEYVGQGVGRRLVKLLLEEARALALGRVFVLTYQPEFFKKCGFVEVPKESMPQKVWKECINCPQFPNCGEVALQIELSVDDAPLMKENHGERHEEVG